MEKKTRRIVILAAGIVLVLAGLSASAISLNSSSNPTATPTPTASDNSLLQLTEDKPAEAPEFTVEAKAESGWVKVFEDDPKQAPGRYENIAYYATGEQVCNIQVASGTTTDFGDLFGDTTDDLTSTSSMVERISSSFAPDGVQPPEALTMISSTGQPVQVTGFQAKAGASGYSDTFVVRAFHTTIDDKPAVYYMIIDQLCEDSSSEFLLTPNQVADIFQVDLTFTPQVF